MGLAKSLRKAGHLQPLSSAIKRYIDKKRKDDALIRLTQSLGKANVEIEQFGSQFDTPSTERFNQRTQRMDQQKNPFIGDFEKQVEGVRGDFIESLIPDIGNLEPGQVSLGLDNIESLIGANQPQRISGTKYKTIGKNVYKLGAGGEIDFEKPSYTIPGEEPSEETQYKKYGRNVYEVGDDGEIDFTKPVYTVPKEKGKEDELPDYSKLLGEVNEGIEKIRSLDKSVVEYSEDVGDDIKKGNLYSYTFEGKKYEDDSLEDEDFTWEQYKSFKEGIKNKYKQPAIQMINEQGLDNAVEDIRQLIEVEGSLDEALNKFKELNGDQFNDEDLRILRDYFTLMTL